MQLTIRKLHKPSLLILLLTALLPACTHTDLSSMAQSAKDNAYWLKRCKTRSLSNKKGQYSQLEIDSVDAPLAAPLQFKVVKLGHYEAKFYQQHDESQSAYVSTIGKLDGDFLAINGGFFTPNFSPDGLFYDHGKILSPMSDQPIFNAMVVVTQTGQIELGTSHMPYKQAAYAIQTGPVLINQGQIQHSAVHQCLESANRTVLAKSSDGQLLVISTSDITLPALETILYDHPEWFGVKKILIAVNLDGGKSSAIYINNSSTHVVENGKSLVENMLLFN